MGFDAVLNAVWLLLGVLALATVLSRARRGRSPVLRCIGVGLVFAALFPVISATDDVIRLQYLERFHPKQEGSRSDTHQRTTDNLIRLYEALESPLSANPVRIFFTAVFAFLSVVLCQVYGRKRTISPSGRAPPVLFT